jgi:hypothetical protein
MFECLSRSKKAAHIGPIQAYGLKSVVLFTAAEGCGVAANAMTINTANVDKGVSSGEIIVGDIESRRLVAPTTTAATALSVRPGKTIARAQALVP